MKLEERCTIQKRYSKEPIVITGHGKQYMYKKCFVKP